jgi:two-component system, LytTR family, response regulator
VLDPNYHICLSDNVNYWVGPIRNISFLEQDGNYCKFTIANASLRLNIRGVLHHFETKLPSSLFFRANRECLINLSHVKHMRAHDPKRYSFIMVNDNEIIMSRKQSVLFRRTKSL